MRKYGIEFEREDMPVKALASRAQIAWEQGRFGSRDAFLRPPLQSDSRVDALEGEVAEIKSSVDKLLALVSHMAKDHVPEMSMPDARARAKELGINTYAMSKEAIVAAIAQAEQMADAVEEEKEESISEALAE